MLCMTSHAQPALWMTRYASGWALWLARRAQGWAFWMFWAKERSEAKDRRCTAVVRANDTDDDR